MKQIVVIIMVLSLMGCFATARKLMEDQMQTAQEVINHTQTECEYWGQDVETCNEWKESLVKLWEAKQLLGQELDGDAIRQWAMLRFIKILE